MTEDEYRKERDYLIMERLGMMCEDRQPTTEQLYQAELFADHEIRRLRRHEKEATR